MSSLGLTLSESKSNKYKSITEEAEIFISPPTVASVNHSAVPEVTQQVMLILNSGITRFLYAPIISLYNYNTKLTKVICYNNNDILY